MANFFRQSEFLATVCCRWDAESLFDKNLLSTLSLLLAIISHFSAQGKVLIDLPNSLSVNVITVRMAEGNLRTEIIQENLIRQLVLVVQSTKTRKIKRDSRRDFAISRCSGYLTSRDGFDTLIDHAPEKLHYVKMSLLQFANAHLSQSSTFVQHTYRTVD